MEVMLMDSVYNSYTAVVQRDGPWWIGWVKEIPGVNCQGITREELIENLHSALKEALEMNIAEAMASTTGEYEEVSLQL
jgi:predicted RNase H-like HicB family nuclease